MFLLITTLKVVNAQADWMRVTAEGARYVVGGEASPTPTARSSPSPSPTPGQVIGDFNNDGTIDLLDFEIFRNLYVENLD